MDPNETLRQIRLTMKQMQVEDGAVGSHRLFHQHARDLVELVEALDGWIANGGFLPDDWGTVPPSLRYAGGGGR